MTIVVDEMSDRSDSAQHLAGADVPESVRIAEKLRRIREIHREQGPRLPRSPEGPVMFECWPAGGGAPTRWMGR